MLCDVRLHGCLDHWCLGVLADQLHDDRVLHGHRVHLDVCLVVLVEERLERFSFECGHVLRHRVFGFLVVRQGHKLVCVLDAQHLQHLAVQLGQVVDVRGHLCHLDDGLVLHNPLAHGGCVGVAHRDDVNVAVVFLLCAAVGLVWVVVVLGVCVVPNQPGQQLQLLLEAVVQPGLNCRHHLQLALKDGQGSAHGRLCAHVRDLHVRRGSKASAFLHDRAQQLVQNAAWLLVRQGQDVVSERSRADVYVPELAGLNRCVVTLNAKSTRFEASWEVRQRSCIDKLAHDAGG